MRIHPDTHIRSLATACRVSFHSQDCIHAGWRNSLLEHLEYRSTKSVPLVHSRHNIEARNRSIHCSTRCRSVCMDMHTVQGQSGLVLL